MSRAFDAVRQSRDLPIMPSEAKNRPMGSWRPMLVPDLAAVETIAAIVHPAYPEDIAVLAEKRELYPAGCMIFGQSGEVSGYLFSHPWRRGAPPKLGNRLGSIPSDADTYYLHDIALLPSARGTGAGRSAMALVVEMAQAAGCRDITLIAVSGADSFWAAQGFTSSGETPYGPGSIAMHRAIS
jgi:GNAT superfamily N-acetyltransferase